MTLKPLLFLLGMSLLFAPADDFRRERDGANDKVKNAAEGKAPPELKAEKWMNTPGDKPLSWKEMRGKVVLIDLWAFW